MPSTVDRRCERALSFSARRMISATSRSALLAKFVTRGSPTRCSPGDERRARRRPRAPSRRPRRRRRRRAGASRRGRRRHTGTEIGRGSGCSAAARSSARDGGDLEREARARGAAVEVRVEQLPLELGQLAVGRERRPRAGAVAKNPCRVAHHGHSDEKYRPEVRESGVAILSLLFPAVLRPLTIASVLAPSPSLAAAAAAATPRRRSSSDGRGRRAQRHRRRARADRAGDVRGRPARADGSRRQSRCAAPPTDVGEADAPDELEDERDRARRAPDRALRRDHLDGRDVRVLPRAVAADERAQLRAVEHGAGRRSRASAREGVKVQPLERHKPEIHAPVARLR